jgi:ornithine decarboxylase
MQYEIKRGHKFFPKKTWEKVLNFLARTDEPTPYLLMDSDLIRQSCQKIGRGIKNSKVFYAMKANPDIEVVKFIMQQGLSFEIASEGELSVLRMLNVGPDRIISSNPVKSPSFIREAYSYGVRLFAFDSEHEIEKLRILAPESELYVRVSVPNEGSEWPLSKKFGVEPDRAVSLLLLAAERGLNPVGITFHVGSQCMNIYNWSTAIDKVLGVWRKVESEGIKLRVLNIGGGYPIRYTREVVDIESIEKMINETIFSQFPEDIEVHIEPGRAVVGEAGVFITRVIGKATRSDENWLYIDVGVFNGLMESIGGIKYTMIVGSRAKPKRWIVAGPSCDSFDVIARDVLLPEPNIGDYLLIPSAGAYTISYASEFNGFPIPKTVLI